MRVLSRVAEGPYFGPAGGIGWYMVHLEPHRSRAQALQPDHRELQRSVVGEGL